MSGRAAPAVDRAAELRRQFDRSFAEARPPEPPPVEDLLAVRLAGQPYALRLGDIAGVFAEATATAIPGARPPLLGIAGIRGTLAPVYDLAAMLGLPQSERPRWLVLAAAARIAFALAELDGCRRVPRTAIAPPPEGMGARHIGGVVRLDGSAQPVVALASAVAAVRQLCGDTRQEPETC